MKRPFSTSTNRSINPSIPQDGKERNAVGLEEKNKKKLRQSAAFLSLRDILFIVVGILIAFLFLYTNDNNIKFDNGATEIKHLVASSSLGGGCGTIKGWKPIHVFYGDMNHIKDFISEEHKRTKKNRGTKTFSQHGQDKAVMEFFHEKRNGYFVDLAANDAVHASNTFSLEQNYGWNGLCIEPNPDYWYRLAFRKCHAVGAVVGNNTMEEVKIKFSNGPYGGIVRRDFGNNRPKRAEGVRYTASLEHIFKEFNTPKIIDYMSLDVEGAEEFIMSSFPFDKYTFLTLSIERPNEKLKKLLEEKGYKFVKDFSMGDTFWAHESVYRDGK